MNKIEKLLKNIKENEKKLLELYPELIELNNNIKISTGYYMALSWLFGNPILKKLYYDGFSWCYFFPNGSFLNEKVSHYIPIQPERLSEKTSFKDDAIV